MQVTLSVRVDHREVHRSEPMKISMVTDATSAVLRELDRSPKSTMDWTRMVVIIDRE
jgi:alkyl hydroperoxide reductase subunit AhpC